MFNELKEIISKPLPYEKSNPEELWNNPHISRQMLEAHLNPGIDAASRNKDFIKESLMWLKQKFQIGEGFSILDLGCGPGLYSGEFARMGADVSAIDFSENSIGYAKEEAERLSLKIDYINADYIEYDFCRKKFDLITLIYCDYCVLNKEQRFKLLQKVYNALDDDGSFMLDVHTRAHFESVEEKYSSYYNEVSGFWLPESHFVFEQILKYEDEHIILEKSDIIGEEERFTIYNYLSCFDFETINKEFIENGLEIREKYADVAGSPYSSRSGTMGIVAKKKI